MCCYLSAVIVFACVVGINLDVVTVCVDCYTRFDVHIFSERVRERARESDGDRYRERGT